MLAVVPPPVAVRVPAKVNLHLGVGDVRPDGYHELSTVFQALSLTDVVTVAAGEPGVEVTGEGADSVPASAENLAWRAAVALAEHVGREPGKVRIIIRKGIPVAGGMAGGSADAAATLVGLAALWKLDIARDELGTIAATLGSDVPFMLHGGTALGTGRGERLVPVLSRHTFHWVIALDRQGLRTPDVYGELDRLRDGGRNARVGSVEPVLEALASGDPRQLALLLGNDLQAAAVEGRQRRDCAVAGKRRQSNALQGRIAVVRDKIARHGQMCAEWFSHGIEDGHAGIERVVIAGDEAHPAA